MSDPEQHDDPNELDLDAETVRDLDPSKSDAGDVRGGLQRPDPEPSATCITCWNCMTAACTIKP
jgi:hypothetical protein